MPLCDRLADWAHHQAPVLVFWTLLLPHSQLTDKIFVWHPRRLHLIHTNYNFTLLQRKIWQREQEDFIEDSHKAAGHGRGFLVPRLAMVALHTDPGVQGCATEGSQISYSYCSMCVCLYFYDAVQHLPASEDISVRTVLTLSSPTSSLWAVGRTFKDRSTSPPRSCPESGRISTSGQ